MDDYKNEEGVVMKTRQLSRKEIIETKEMRKEGMKPPFSQSLSGNRPFEGEMEV